MATQPQPAKASDHFMEITGSEAFLLLQKWRDEERSVTCAVMATANDKTFQVGCVLGRINNLSADAVRVESISGSPGMQTATYLEIPLSRASFRYVEPQTEARLDRDIVEALADVGADRLIDSCLLVQLERSCIVYSLSVLPKGL